MRPKRRGSSARGRDARGLGAISEDLIKLWASQLDLVATQSQRDWEGWDLASDLSSNELDAWGLAPPPIICRFQIKSTSTKSRSIRISRANALRMAQQPIPWFVVLVRYVGKAPQNVDLVHIDETMVGEILGWAVKSPKATEFTIHADRSGVEVAPTPQAWFLSIENLIGDKKTYVVRKCDWVTKAGRTERPVSFSCAVLDTREEELADFFLGRRPTLTVQQGSISEERFGVRRVRETFADAKMQIQNLAPAAKVVLTARGSGKLASIECDLYSVRPWLPETSRYARRVRFKATYFDLVVCPDAEKKTGVGFDFPAEMDLARAAEETRFFHVLHTAETLTVTYKDKVVPMDPLRFPWSPDEKNFFDSILATHQLLSSLGLRTRPFTTASLLKGETLAIARAILGDEKSKLLNFSFMGGSTTNLPAVVLSPFTVSDGQHQAGFIVRFDGAPRVEELVYFDIRSQRTIDRFAFVNAEAEGKLVELLKNHADAIEAAEKVNVTYIVQ